MLIYTKFQNAETTFSFYVQTRTTAIGHPDLKEKLTKIA